MQDIYNFLLNIKVLQCEKEDEGGTISWIPVKCKSELLNPHLEWGRIWELAKIKGISNKSRTFLWRLLNNLLRQNNDFIIFINPRLKPASCA